MFDKSKGLLAAARLTGGVEVDASRGRWKGAGRLKGYRPPGSGLAEEEELVAAAAPAALGAPSAGANVDESDVELSSDSDSESRRRRYDDLTTHRL